MKTCTKCSESKPVTAYSKHAGRSDGLDSRCKACANIVSAAWRAANPEKAKANSAAWAASNPKKVGASNAKWRNANPEKSKAINAAWAAANHERRKATAAQWAAANPEKARASTDKWQKAHPEALRINNHNRRARKQAAGGTLSKGLAGRLFTLQRGKCACGCGQQLGADYHLDHRMPLALGGTNTDDNMQLLRSTCNLQKHAKHPVDFMQSRGFLI